MTQGSNYSPPSMAGLPTPTSHMNALHSGKLVAAADDSNQKTEANYPAAQYPPFR
jgi:uncharacterized protein (DUF427 family)